MYNKNPKFCGIKKNIYLYQLIREFSKTYKVQLSKSYLQLIIQSYYYKIKQRRSILTKILHFFNLFLISSCKYMKIANAMATHSPPSSINGSASRHCKLRLISAWLINFYYVRNQEKQDNKKLNVRTFFTQYNLLNNH